MKKIIGIVLVVFLIIAGYFGYQYYQNQKITGSNLTSLELTKKVLKENFLLKKYNFINTDWYLKMDADVKGKYKHEKFLIDIDEKEKLDVILNIEDKINFYLNYNFNIDSFSSPFMVGAEKKLMKGFLAGLKIGVSVIKKNDHYYLKMSNLESLWDRYLKISGQSGADRLKSDKNFELVKKELKKLDNKWLSLNDLIQSSGFGDKVENEISNNVNKVLDFNKNWKKEFIKEFVDKITKDGLYVYIDVKSGKYIDGLTRYSLAINKKKLEKEIKKNIKNEDEYKKIEDLIWKAFKKKDFYIYIDENYQIRKFDINIDFQIDDLSAIDLDNEGMKGYVKFILKTNGEQNFSDDLNGKKEIKEPKKYKEISKDFLKRFLNGLQRGTLNEQMEKSKIAIIKSIFLQIPTQAIIDNPNSFENVCDNKNIRKLLNEVREYGEIKCKSSKDSYTIYLNYNNKYYCGDVTGFHILDDSNSIVDGVKCL